MGSGETPGNAPAPPRGVVARPALNALIARGARVTQLTGPAGGGKTFLLRSWAADAGATHDIAWVSVTRDGDPQQFWLALAAALHATPATASLVPELTPTTEFDAVAVVDRLLQGLSALATPVWLVIDDLHELSSPEATQGLRRLIHDGPRALRFVLATRTAVALDLHRLRLEGELTEIRGPELRFSLAEARALFDGAGIELSDAALSQLVARTEGWAAGLRLAALSLERHPDPERLAMQFSGNEQTVAEYLIAEVLQRLPDEVAQLLLRTSILDRVSGPLADRLTGGHGAERVLAEMEQSGAFVVSLDPQREWFRYHPLFAELLARELRRTAPDEVAGLHATAAAWLAQHDQPLEAIRQAQAIPDWELAAATLSEHWFTLLLDGRRATVQELLQRFPTEMITTHAQLSVVAAGLEFIGGSLEEGERYVALATRTLDPAASPRLRTELAALRLGLARERNDLTTVSEQALWLLRALDETLVPSEELRIFTLSNIGAAELSLGRFDDADQHLAHAVELTDRSNRPLPKSFALADWAQLASFISAPDAERRSREAIELSETHGWGDGKAVGIAATVLGNVLLWRGRLAEAQTWLGRAQGALPPESEPATAMMLHAAEAMLSYVRGDRRGASEAATAAERVGGLLIGNHVVATRARAQLLVTIVRLGEVERARASWGGLGSAGPEGREGLPGAIVQAALALADDDPEAATAVLAGPVTLALENRVDDVWPTQVLLLEAIARDLLNDSGATAAALEQALDRAESNGLIFPFLFFPAAEMLERHVRLGTAHASLTYELLNRLAGRAPADLGVAVAPLPEPLSDSELRVVRYLPTNLQAPEIAAELFVSVNTIRTHMRHAYTKLGVHRRAEAVSRARELGLLASGSPQRVGVDGPGSRQGPGNE